MSVVLDVQSLVSHIREAVLELQRRGLKVILVYDADFSGLPSLLALNEIKKDDLLFIKAYNRPTYVDAIRIAAEYEAFHVTKATMEELLSASKALYSFCMRYVDY